MIQAYRVKSFLTNNFFTTIMRNLKILIIGNGGTGKSTLADKLSKELKIPVTHMDLLSWQDDFIRVSDLKIEEELSRLFKCEEMIIEGWSLHSTLFKRLKWANVIIYLKFPLDYCLKSVYNRNREFNNKTYPFDPFTGDREKLNPIYKEALEKVHFEYEPDLQKWLERDEIKNKTIYTFNSIFQLNSNYDLLISNLRSMNHSIIE